MRDIQLFIPELILLVAAAILFVMGGSSSTGARKTAPLVALGAIACAFVTGLYALKPFLDGSSHGVYSDVSQSLTITGFSAFIRVISIGVGSLFVLLAWPTSSDGSGNRAINFSTETAEYFALLLLAITGISVVSASSSLATLFLGIELASIPTYIMVAMSRPQGIAQEAGIKYFFLGAVSAALMLLGISYLFGVTGELNLNAIASVIGAQHGVSSPLTSLAIVLLVMSFLFKMAAFPLHFYAGDVYQGAATPVTAAIAFIPKITGVAALLKVLYVAGGGHWLVDPKLAKLLWILALLTMTIGNVLGLLQYNVKRVLAYSSIAHSGYLLMAIVTIINPVSNEIRSDSLAGILYYILIYGIMNVAAFGVLVLLPSKIPQAARSAETYDDLAGLGWKHPVLGVIMAISCFSLIGIPSTAGFLGKLYLLKPAIQSASVGPDNSIVHSSLLWLAIFTLINAAISAGYYLKIVVTMWSSGNSTSEEEASHSGNPIALATTVAALVVIVLGLVLPLSNNLFSIAKMASIGLLGH